MTRAFGIALLACANAACGSVAYEQGAPDADAASIDVGDSDPESNLESGDAGPLAVELPPRPLFAMGETTCALAGGAVRCWGVWDGAMYTRPTLVPTLVDVREMGFGYSTCIRNSDAIVECSGRNGEGELGNGTTTDRSTMAPVPGVRAVNISVGWGACARLSSAQVTCWGPVELPGPRPWLSPSIVSTLEGALEISFAGGDVAVRFSDGSVHVSGMALPHQIGAPAGPDLQRVPLPGGLGATQIAADVDASCAVLEDRTVACWGKPDFGMLGGAKKGPAVIGGLRDVVQVDVENSHACARLLDGRVACWGANSYGADGSFEPEFASHPDPYFIPGLTGIVHIAVGRGHQCALRSDGKIFCWGTNTYGAVGDGTTVPRPVPTEIP